MILMIDNYDSFVFNVEQYLKELSCEEVRTVNLIGTFCIVNYLLEIFL